MNDLFEIITTDMFPNYYNMESCSVYDQSLADYYVGLPKGKEDLLLDKLNLKNKILRDDLKSKLGTDVANEQILRYLKRTNQNKCNYVQSLTEYMVIEYGSVDDMLMEFGLLDKTDLGLSDDFLRDITQPEPYSIDELEPSGEDTEPIQPLTPTPTPTPKQEPSIKPTPKLSKRMKTRKLGEEDNDIGVQDTELFKDSFVQEVDDKDTTQLQDSSLEHYNDNEENNNEKENEDEGVDANLLIGYIYSLCNELNINFEKLTEEALDYKTKIEHPEFARADIINFLDVLQKDGYIDENYSNMIIYCYDSGRKEFAETEVNKLANTYEKYYKGV